MGSSNPFILNFLLFSPFSRRLCPCNLGGGGGGQGCEVNKGENFCMINHNCKITDVAISLKCKVN